MDVFLSGPLSGFFGFSEVSIPTGSVTRDLTRHFINETGIPSEDFYVICNGRLSHQNDPLQDGAIYRLEPRLCGGKGGFGSMLRALGAQIEKTTNREACRDLSGRRLRDVNHEKEMAEWLKKQAEREAEKEQRRLERLQRKLAEPKHHFTDADYQQQCHNLSERLEDSVMKGLQASSSELVSTEEGPSGKRANRDKDHPTRKRKCLWTGGGDLDDLVSSDEEDGEEEDEDDPGCGASGLVSSVRKTAESQPSSSDVGSELQQETRLEASCRPAEPESTQPDHLPASGPAAEDLKSKSIPCSTHSSQSSTSEHVPVLGPVDLEALNSAEELEVFGLDVLKAELMSRGLKCGGTLTERAVRLFSVKDLSPDQLDPALLAKTGKAKKK
ncbi:splicing regulator SDE2 [Lampris incognitus]|uniref:splicing regulator SDE2 n=1 Tax=Lampris incognitus TaxID=2546036 RepID=UPI0024B4EB06|nr:splicing regulator SDE2 [Lampris incognitus]